MSCLAAPDDYPELSQRQLDVIKLMTEGLRLKEMAFELGISEGAVNKHISCIRKKYQADIIVRITGDCPLVDPKIVDEILGVLLICCMAFFYGLAQVFSRQLKEIDVKFTNAFMGFFGFIILLILSIFL